MDPEVEKVLDVSDFLNTQVYPSIEFSSDRPFSIFDVFDFSAVADNRKLLKIFYDLSDCGIFQNICRILLINEKTHVAGVRPLEKIVLDFDMQSENANAEMSWPELAGGTLSFNQHYVEGALELSVVSTIIHELCHGILGKMEYLLGYLDTGNLDYGEFHRGLMEEFLMLATNSPMEIFFEIPMYKELYNKSDDRNDNRGWEHNFMADKMQGLIKDVMKQYNEIRPVLKTGGSLHIEHTPSDPESIQKLTDKVQKYITEHPNKQVPLEVIYSNKIFFWREFSLEELLDALALEGLHGTTYHKNMNKETKEFYSLLTKPITDYYRIPSDAHLPDPKDKLRGIKSYIMFK